MNVLCVGRARSLGDVAIHNESVVVMVYRDGSQRVVLVAGDSVCGTAVGHWPAGFFDGELPADHNVAYIARRFGLREQDASRKTLRVWNRLYLEALEDLRERVQAMEVKSGNEG